MKEYATVVTSDLYNQWSHAVTYSRHASQCAGPSMEKLSYLIERDGWSVVSSAIETHHDPRDLTKYHFILEREIRSEPTSEGVK